MNGASHTAVFLSNIAWVHSDVGLNRRTIHKTTTIESPSTQESRCQTLLCVSISLNSKGGNYYYYN
jgi:hypothetical protein